MMASQLLEVLAKSGTGSTKLAVALSWLDAQPKGCSADNLIAAMASLWPEGTLAKANSIMAERKSATTLPPKGG